MTFQRNVPRFCTRSICGWNLFQQLELRLAHIVYGHRIYSFINSEHKPYKLALVYAERDVIRQSGVETMLVQHRSGILLMTHVCGGLFSRWTDAKKRRDTYYIKLSIPVLYKKPSLIAHSVRLWLQYQRYRVRIPARSDVCHWGCAYTVCQTVQRPGLRSAVYGTMHYEDTFKSFKKSMTRSWLRASFCCDIVIIVQKAT